jgi:hypothetical protein
MIMVDKGNRRRDKDHLQRHARVVKEWIEAYAKKPQLPTGIHGHIPRNVGVLYVKLPEPDWRKI